MAFTDTPKLGCPINYLVSFYPNQIMQPIQSTLEKKFPPSHQFYLRFKAWNMINDKNFQFILVIFTSLFWFSRKVIFDVLQFGTRYFMRNVSLKIINFQTKEQVFESPKILKTSLYNRFWSIILASVLPPWLRAWLLCWNFKLLKVLLISLLAKDK